MGRLKLGIFLALVLASALPIAGLPSVSVVQSVAKTGGAAASISTALPAAPTANNFALVVDMGVTQATSSYGVTDPAANPLTGAGSPQRAKHFTEVIPGSLSAGPWTCTGTTTTYDCGILELKGTNGTPFKQGIGSGAATGTQTPAPIAANVGDLYACAGTDKTTAAHINTGNSTGSGVSLSGVASTTVFFNDTASGSGIEVYGITTSTAPNCSVNPGTNTGDAIAVTAIDISSPSAGCAPFTYPYPCWVNPG
jgi:hypothetical protein